MKCAVYIRVSTNKEEQKTSLENQKNLFYCYIAERGWDIYEIYVDVETGTTDKRQNLQKLIEDARHRKFDVILAKELSRLARNSKLSYEIKDVAERSNIHIITLDNAIDTMTGNISMFGLYAWIYEQESQRTSERIKAARRTLAGKGEFKGSIPPYGYLLVDGKLHIRDDDSPNVVKLIFRMYLEGKGFDAIARAMTKSGYPTPAKVAGKKNAGEYWQGSTIKLILSNPHYVGDLVQCRETTRSVTSQVRTNLAVENQVIVPNCHSHMVSRTDFDTVQQYMKNRKRNITKVKNHLFTNILYCADCGSGMWYRQNRKGYICGSYARHSKKACTHHAISETALKHIILNDIRKMSSILDDQIVQKQIESKAKTSRKSILKQLESVERDIGELKGQNKQFIKLLAQEAITQREYREAVDSNSSEIEQLEIKKSDLTRSLSKQDDAKVFLHLKQEITKFLEFDDLTEELLHRLVEKIEVEADGAPRIFYRFTAPLCS